MINETQAVELLKRRIAEWNSQYTEIKDGYEYEKRFVAMVRQFNEELLQQSVGSVPKSKNEKKSPNHTGADKLSEGSFLSK